jgi:hypothetical protein
LCPFTEEEAARGQQLVREEPVEQGVSMGNWGWDPSPEPKDGGLLPPAWSVCGGEKPQYLPGLLRSRKQTRVATRAIPTRTPITMSVMAPAERPVTFPSAEKRKGKNSVPEEP